MTEYSFFLLQLEEQKFEMKKLKRDFEEKRAEVEHVKGTLQRTEKVCMLMQ